MRARALLFALTFAAAGAGAACGDEAETLTASYPEGPLWQGDRLYYAEMRADRVKIYEAGQARDFFAQPGCGPTAIAPYGEGFLILCHLGARIVAVNAQGGETRRWDRDQDGDPLTNPNDASADGAGGVYFTDPGPFSRQAGARGRVMHLSADGALSRAVDFLSYPNGVHVKGDALYVSEHLGGRVLRYDVEAQGGLSGRTVFIDIANVAPSQRYQTPYALTGPDGLEIGPDGDLYVAIYGEGRLLRFSPRGELVGEIETPTRFLTNIAFSEAGFAATTGAFDNRNAPFPGEVRLYSGTP
jgi:sugar lactone lactonase YvrE